MTFRNDKLKYDGSPEREAFSVSLNVVLNRAARANSDGKFLIAVKITQGDSKRYFINVDDLRIAEADFNALCREYSVLKNGKGRYADIAAKINTVYDRVLTLLEVRVGDGSFDFDEFKDSWQTFKEAKEVELTPYELW